MPDLLFTFEGGNGCTHGYMHGHSCAQMRMHVVGSCMQVQGGVCRGRVPTCGMAWGYCMGVRAQSHSCRCRMRGMRGRGVYAVQILILLRWQIPEGVRSLRAS